MSPVHFHLLSSHVPVIGVPLVVALLAWGLVRREESAARAALGFSVLLALATLAVYLTGEPAEEIVEGLMGVSEPMMERHEAVALWAFVATEVVGVLALAGLLAGRWLPGFKRVLTVGTLAAGLVATALLARTGYYGGQIRHDEIRTGAPSAANREVEH